MQTKANLPTDHADRTARALLSLDGLSVGDSLGQRFFYRFDFEWIVKSRAIPSSPWQYTDDTVMALSIVETLDRFGEIDHDHLAERFAARYADDPRRGYGATARDILEDIGNGVPWQIASSRVFDGAGSMGNGGAMRAGPVGAYFADDFQAVIEHATASARVTHFHAEGQAGAIAVAIAAAQAWRIGQRIEPTEPSQILEAAIEHTPKGKTRTGLRAAMTIPFSEPVESAVATLGNGSGVISHDTVPFALWCAARHLTNFEDAFWSAASAAGDIDTNCAIVGSIVAMAVGRDRIPAEWIAAREPLIW